MMIIIGKQLQKKSLCRSTTTCSAKTGGNACWQRAWKGWKRDAFVKAVCLLSFDSRSNLSLCHSGQQMDPRVRPRVWASLQPESWGVRGSTGLYYCQARWQEETRQQPERESMCVCVHRRGRDRKGQPASLIGAQGPREPGHSCRGCGGEGGAKSAHGDQLFPPVTSC